MTRSVTSLLVLFITFIDVRVTDCQRLVPSVKPVHYDLVILPVFTGEEPRLCGHVYVDFISATRTNVLTLNSLNLDFIDVALVNEPERLVRVEELCFLGSNEMRNSGVTLHVDKERQQVDFIFKKSFSPATKYRLSIVYKAEIYDEPKGFFRASYERHDSCCQSWFGGTQMEITHARRVFPCFDEPAFKATFKITVGHQVRNRALSNMLETSTKPMSTTDEWIWTSYLTSPPLSTYLVAITITEDYEYVSRLYKDCNRSVLLRFWAKPGQIDMLNAAISIVPDMLQLLERFFNKTLPVSKIDFMPAPIKLDFAAMENHGLIFFREDFYYYDEQKGDSYALYNVAQTIGHELLHHFFGNLVTISWWDDIWFVEGLCGMFEDSLIRSVLPQLDYEGEESWMRDFFTTMTYEENEVTRPAISYQEDPEKLQELFGSIAYGKSKIVLTMAANFLGADTFRQGVINFLNEYEYKNANSSHFWRVLNNEVRHDRTIGKEFDIAQVMDSWTRQASYPIVECKWIDGGKVSLSQKPFPGASNASASWWIPIAIADNALISPAAKLPRLWLTPNRPAMRVALTNTTNDTWILMNADLYGYFRVEYDEHNWNLISNQLIEDHSVIPRKTRYQLVDDAFTLASVNLIPYEIPLKLIRYLKKKDDQFVLPRALEYLDIFKQLLKDNSTMLRLIEDFTFKVTHIGWEEFEANQLARSQTTFVNETFSKTYCQLENEFCINQALRLFENAMVNNLSTDEESFMKRNLDWIWCSAIRFSGNKEWLFAWKASTSKDWITLRGEILSAMGCTKQEKNLKSLLSRIYHPDIVQYSSHTTKLIEGMTYYPESRHLAAKFLMSNWEFLLKHLGNLNETIKLLEKLTMYYRTYDDYYKMKKFFKDKGIDEKNSKAASILKNIENNVIWIQKNAANFGRSLESEYLFDIAVRDT